VRLTVLGCSPSFPSPGGHSSSYLLEEEGTQLLIDCGHGSGGQLRAVSDVASLSAIVLSHMHPDHFFDLIPLRYAVQFLDAGHQIPLWLPPDGADMLAGLLRPLGLPDDFFTGTYDVREYDPDGTLTVGSLSVRFAVTRHFIPAYAMRIRHVSRNHPAFFFSSDTAWSDSVRALAGGADLALVEATQAHQNGGGELGHLTGSLAGKLAQEAAVGRLVLTHYPASLGSDLLSQARAEYSGSVELAVECETYEV
jgi:ribonuclease BN (tRNA processing enzyme)